MKTKRVVDKKIRISEPGLNVHADVKAVVAANVAEPGAVSRSSVRRRSSERRTAAGGRRKDRRGRG